MSSITLLGAILVGIACVTAGFMDLAIMKIKNELVLLLLLAYLLLAPFSGLTIIDISCSLAAGFLVLICMLCCFHFGWVGGGDAKLLSVLAIWLGIHNTLSFLLLTAVLGGGLTLLMLGLRQMPLPQNLQSRAWITRLHSAETGIPYGVAIVGAALAMLPQTIWL
jgi:prepilin peptidase CpaA